MSFSYFSVILSCFLTKQVFFEQYINQIQIDEHELIDENLNNSRDRDKSDWASASGHKLTTQRCT